MFGCGSTNLARLANHLDQVHDMSTEERKKWLKWRKIGIIMCTSTQRRAKEDQYAGESGKFISTTRRNGKKL